MPQLSAKQSSVSLPVMIDRAANLLAGARTYAEALAAKETAAAAYDVAKRASRAAQLKGNFDQIAKRMQQAQREALKIETKAKALLAAKYDEAKKRGEVAGHGAPKGGRGNQAGKVPKQNVTTTDLGIDRKLIMEGRKINEAEAVNPGIVEETLDASDEPTRTQLNAAIKQATAKPPAELGKAPECFTVAEWSGLHPDARLTVLTEGATARDKKFLKQSTDGIEWAQWSWNPVTGCLHECPYCYARDIAEHRANAFPHGFAPAFWPMRLGAPRNTAIPGIATFDTRFKNVFTCSMADLFGRWVPREWIIAVLGTVQENPQWNFLFLTKFPKRMAEFEIPPNAWMGTTVDLQARVKSAEQAFAKINSGIRWLSVEPLLEPLKFERLDLFQWMVIGGASRSSQTPEWRPPIDWIIDLRAQARAAGLAIYDKTNLYGNRTLELPFDAPIKADPTEAPAVFHYLGNGKEAAAA